MEPTSSIGRVKGWLLAKRPDLKEIDFDMDLIENRVVDSLGFIDFVYFLEELTGRELQEHLQSVDSFRSLRTIQSKILQWDGHGGQLGI